MEEKQKNLLHSALNNKYILPTGAIAIVIVLVVIIGSTYLSPDGLFAHQPAKTNLVEVSLVNIGYQPLVPGAPLFLAQDNNYFEKAGINIEATPFDSPNGLVDALMQGKIDIAITNAPTGIIAVANVANPGKIKIYSLASSTEDNPNESLMVDLNSTITSFADLNGKKLAILGGSIQWKAISTELLAQNGLTVEKDVTIVELPPLSQAQALATHQIDAVIAVEPVKSTILAKKIGKEIIQAPVATYITDPFFVVGGAINVEFAKNNPKTTAKLLAVINKATTEVNDYPTEARESLKTHLKLSDDVLYKLNIPKYVTCATITPADVSALQKFFDVFTKQGIIKQSVNAKELMYCN